MQKKTKKQRNKSHSKKNKNKKKQTNKKKQDKTNNNGKNIKVALQNRAVRYHHPTNKKKEKQYNPVVISYSLEGVPCPIIEPFFVCLTCRYQ